MLWSDLGWGSQAYTWWVQFNVAQIKNRVGKKKEWGREKERCLDPCGELNIRQALRKSWQILKRHQGVENCQ